MAATKVELFEQIRRDSWHGGLSVRALAAKYGVHRRLVREALTRAEPAPRKTPERRSARLEPFKAVIDGWLRDDLDAPRKQRHTATRVHARLLAGWQVPGMPEEPAAREFTRHVTSGSRWYLGACICLDDVLAFEGLGPLPDPDEPGAALCRAARDVILAWRQPEGSSDHRDATVRAFITATGLVSAGALGLSAYAPRRTFIGLQAVIASLAEVVADLSAAVGEPPAEPARDDSASRSLPAPRQPGTEELS